MDCRRGRWGLEKRGSSCKKTRVYVCERYLQEGFMGGGASTNHLHKFTLERYVKAGVEGGPPRFSGTITQ